MNRGFRRLIEHIEPRYSLPSRCYFSDISLPALHEVIATHIHKLLDNVTDIHYGYMEFGCKSDEYVEPYCSVD